MCVARATCDRAAKGPRKGLAAARPEMLKVTGCKLASCNTPFLRSCAPCSASAAPLAAACQSTAPPRHRLPLARPRGAAPSRRQPPRATAPRARAANSLRGWRSCARLPRAPWCCTPASCPTALSHPTRLPSCADTAPSRAAACTGKPYAYLCKGDFPHRRHRKPSQRLQGVSELASRY